MNNVTLSFDMVHRVNVIKMKYPKSPRGCERPKNTLEYYWNLNLSHTSSLHTHTRRQSPCIRLISTATLVVSTASNYIIFHCRVSRAPAQHTIPVNECVTHSFIRLLCRSYVVRGKINRPSKCGVCVCVVVCRVWPDIYLLFRETQKQKVSTFTTLTCSFSLCPPFPRWATRSTCHFKIRSFCRSTSGTKRLHLRFICEYFLFELSRPPFLSLTLSRPFSYVSFIQLKCICFVVDISCSSVHLQHTHGTGTFLSPHKHMNHEHECNIEAFGWGHTAQANHLHWDSFLCSIKYLLTSVRLFFSFFPSFESLHPPPSWLSSLVVALTLRRSTCKSISISTIGRVCIPSSIISMSLHP